MKINAVVGTRPEAIKLAPVILELRRRPWCEVTVTLSGQHGDMARRALEQFEIEADVDLAVMTPGQTLNSLTGNLFQKLGPALENSRPDLVLAQGDTTTVVVAAMAAFHVGIPFGHVEAGLRTNDLKSPFPEEFNRVVAGKIAQLHFTPTEAAEAALLREGVSADKVYRVGNTVIDALAYTAERSAPERFTSPTGRRRILFTNHRRENFGESMRGVMRRLRSVVEGRNDVDVLFPMHPNPAVRRLVSEELEGAADFYLIEPLEYRDFVAAMQAADIIVTDSGGVQEEAPFLGKPTLVTRTETERPEAVTFGVARLVGVDPDLLSENLTALLDAPSEYDRMARGVSPYGDGEASRRIAEAIAHAFDIDGTKRPEAFVPQA